MDQWHGLTPRQDGENDGPPRLNSHGEQSDDGGRASDEGVVAAAVPRNTDDVQAITAVAYERFQEKERERRARTKGNAKRSRKNANWRKRTRNRAAEEKLNKYMEKRRCVET